MRPRTYLSWSSLDLFERSPKQWAKVYLFNEKNYDNAGSRFGHKMAEGLELDEATGDPMLDVMTEMLTKYEIRDQPIEVTLNAGRGKEPILLHGRPDTRTDDFSKFGEYKAGQEPWTQTKVDKSGQITFYATIGYIFRGNKLVEQMWLEQVMTVKIDPEDQYSELKPTGEILRFKTQRLLPDILNMMVRMKKAWSGMEKLTNETFL